MSSATTDKLENEKYWSKSGMNGWFESSNHRPTVNQTRALADNTSPPHFLRQNSSSSSSDIVRSYNRGMGAHATSALVRSMSTGGKSDDYRSVIDDLTIENRKLKQKLRKYEAARRPHLEKETLFEIKFHGLPPKKRRELEEQLSAFAASIESLGDCGHENAVQDKRHASSSLSNSASNSRPADSGYNSMSNGYIDMSNSGPTSNSNSDRKSPPNADGKGKRIESFLTDIPEGLMPRSTALSERQKKKLVVKRLEQLFAGRIASTGEHSQPLQQQEVSDMAAKADRDTELTRLSVEGVREAHMLKYTIESGAMDTEDQCSSDQEPKTDSSGEVSPRQRPTRPLDLDPDRAQIPSDNVDYIRHLGLSTPDFAAEESEEDGWIYLNLLMSMAQLHIINVTADFVRSAVADVSEKFQLSSDGQKIRWKGGVGRTRMSSDSEISSGRNQSPHDSDSLEETARKRHKADRGKFAAIPISSQDPSFADTRTSPLHQFHYKPLFKHRESSSSDDSPTLDSDSNSSRHSNTFSNENGKLSKESKATPSKERHKRQHGGIVFYNGQFCIDLSGDLRRRPSITMEAHDETRDILGCSPRKRKVPSRTQSGSSLPFIPLKKIARDNTQETPTVGPLTSDMGTTDLDSDWPSSTTMLEVPMLPLTVSGIGGTQPSDHFALRVQTRRTVLSSRTRAKRSTRGQKQWRTFHTIHHSLLDTFRASERRNSSGSITSGVAALDTFGSSSPYPPTDSELPIQTEIINTQFTRLDPSPLPAPSNFYGMASSSDYSEGSEGSSSSAKRQTWQDRPRIQQSTLSDEEDQNDELDLEDETSSESSSIDMLASARSAHPQLVAVRERAFEREEALSTAVTSAMSVMSESNDSELASIESENSVS